MQHMVVPIKPPDARHDAAGPPASPIPDELLVSEASDASADASLMVVGTELLEPHARTPAAMQTLKKALFTEGRVPRPVLLRQSLQHRGET